MSEKKQDNNIGTRATSQSKSIPKRTYLLTDWKDLPNDYSTTPGGTFYSTTPGGSKIVYDKSLLLSLRNSPSSMSPPPYDIPHHLSPNSLQDQSKKTIGNNKNHNNLKKPLVGSPKKYNPSNAKPQGTTKSPKKDESELFDMEI